MAANVERPLEWMRFEPTKFLYLVDGFEAVQVGLTSKLLCRLWEFGPMSQVDVKRACGTSFEAIRERMLEVDGLLSFELVENARAYGKRSQAQRVAAGHASAAKRNDKTTTAQRPMNDRSTDALSMSMSKSSSTQERKERATPEEKKRKAKNEEPEMLFDECGITPEDAYASNPVLHELKPDWRHYHATISAWSASSGKKRGRKAWLATFRTFIHRDNGEGRLKTKELRLVLNRDHVAPSMFPD